jgi:hypothetical protein
LLAIFLFVIIAAVFAIKIKSHDDANAQPTTLGLMLDHWTTAAIFEGQPPEDVSNAITAAALESEKSQAKIESVKTGHGTKCAPPSLLIHRCAFVFINFR